MTEALGMIFTTEAPNFGSIRFSKYGEYTLLSADVSKLNTLLTRANIGSIFNVPNGATALVLDDKKIYMYDSAGDTWHEWGETAAQT